MFCHEVFREVQCLICTVLKLCFLGSVKFIDYEYADFNYQAFDIANHFNEFAGRQELQL